MERSWALWQEQIKKLCSLYESYKIHLIYSPESLEGKEELIKVLQRKGLAKYIDTSSKLSRNKIMGSIIDNGAPGAFIFDEPNYQAIEFWHLVECLKDGHVFDNRYKFRDMIFDRPQVFIFTTIKPNLKVIDQFINSQKFFCWTIDSELGLVELK